MSLSKTIERFNSKFEEGDLYEAHQTLRSLVSRKVRAKKYDEAVELLFNGSKKFLVSEQQTIGQDLFEYLMQVYGLGAVSIESAEAKFKVIKLISLLNPAEDLFNKKISKTVVDWSVSGASKYGDPDVHFGLANVLILNSKTVYDAEYHLLLSNGTADSFHLYFNLIWSWYTEDPHNTPGLFLARIVVNYLQIENYHFAVKALNLFISKLVSEQHLGHQEIDESGFRITSFDLEGAEQDSRLINFVQLLVILIKYKNTDLFKKLANHYANDLAQTGYAQAVEYLGQVYFDIKVVKQVNLLQNLMNGFLSGK